MFEVVILDFISSYLSAVELLRVSLEANQKCPRNVLFSLCSGGSIVGTYLAGIKMRPKNVPKTRTNA